MILFGHVGLSIGTVHLANRRLGYETDLRAVAVASVAADLIDKPIAMLYPEVFGNHTRLFGHSLLLTVLGLAVMLWPLRVRLVNAVTIWGVLAGHLVLDLMWRRDLHALLWPFLGKAPPLEHSIWEFWKRGVVWWYSIAGEVAGLAVLIALFPLVKQVITNTRHNDALAEREGGAH